ncbi:MAG TPA: cysteine peptidase family C39 domain-containing protein [Sedimentisphaerales bacterium]|nr:cysteine peptidase family C39 domain-containing protein [Sedimentisphaerales bacterium]
MKAKHYVLTILCLFSVSGIAFGDRQLERVEILQILEKLTSQPTKTWIAAGTIEATHEEYMAPKITNASAISTEITKAIHEYQNSPDKRELTEELQKMRLDAIPFNVRYRLSNELTMNSTVVVKFDGNRFYWEINVDSRKDSVKPNAALKDNFMTKQFNLEWNARRIFSWDGQKYTMYSLPANQAMVDTTNSFPHVVNGPLTAGFIPWGYGLYTYKNLSAAASSAIEKDIDGQTQIHLTLNNSDGSEMLFVLDAGRNYAVISHSTDGPDKIISRQYDNYRLVSGTLVPMTILIEQYDTFTNRLLATDFWDFTSISGDTPSVGNFSVDYEPDALIEYRSDVTDKPALYRYSYTVDSDQLLTERLDYAASEGVQAQNCATAALKYAASQLGRDFTYRQLAQMVDRPGRATSLNAMKDFAQRSGLYCRAVRTDVQTLKGLSGCQVILHFPKKNHFTVLEGIDNEYAWSVDLSKDKFYYRTDLNFLDMDWTEGTAFLISDRPIQLQGNSTEIADSQLSNIIGGSGYTCTRLLQEYDIIFCMNPVVGECDGYYEGYPTRYGCEAAESGSCVTEMMVRSAEIFCIMDPYDPYNCSVTGDWSFFYMRACA